MGLLIFLIFFLSFFCDVIKMKFVLVVCDIFLVNIFLLFRIIIGVSCLVFVMLFLFFLFSFLEIIKVSLFKI